MIGRTLGLYLARRFGNGVMIVLATIFILIYTIDFVELLRRGSDVAGGDAATMALLALLRTPATLERILPFALLFGAMASLIGLSRKLELVIARAAGYSVWQFLAPALLVALALGAGASVVFNPLAAHFKDRAGAIEARLFSRPSANSGKEIWFRQRSVDGEAIFHAVAYDPVQSALMGVTVFVMDDRNRILERIEAQKADLRAGYWLFQDARTVSVDEVPQTFARYMLASTLRPDELKANLGPDQSADFWTLPETIERLSLAGLDTTRYRLLYQNLLARPAFLITMVLIAGCFSLRFLRSGGVAQMVLGGMIAGFGLYVATEVAQDLGKAGMVTAIFAAWMPLALGASLAVLRLLYQEDG